MIVRECIPQQRITAGAMNIGQCIHLKSGYYIKLGERFERPEDSPEDASLIPRQPTPCLLQIVSLAQILAGNPESWLGGGKPFPGDVEGVLCEVIP